MASMAGGSGIRTPRRVGLVCPVSFEASIIRKALKFRGLAGFWANLSVSGVGAVNTARAVTAIAENDRPGLVMLFGIGGAYKSSGLRPGDIALAESEVFADLGAPDMKALGIPLIKKGRKSFYNEFPLDHKLAAWAGKTLGPDVISGTFLTVSSLPATEREASRLGKRYNAVCENMEGAAAAQVCAHYGIPLIEIRGISNMAGVRDKRRWKIKEASENCQQAVIELLKKM